MTHLRNLAAICWTWFTSPLRERGAVGKLSAVLCVALTTIATVLFVYSHLNVTRTDGKPQRPDITQMNDEIQQLQKNVTDDETSLRGIQATLAEFKATNGLISYRLDVMSTQLTSIENAQSKPVRTEPDWFSYVIPLLLGGGWGLDRWRYRQRQRNGGE